MVRRQDVESASVLLREVMVQAEALWIPPDAIAEALVEELRRVTLEANGADGAAAYLRALAEEIETSSRGVCAS